MKKLLFIICSLIAFNTFAMETRAKTKSKKEALEGLVKFYIT